jgi:hypothetical protein
MSAKPYSVFDVGIKNIYHVPAQRNVSDKRAPQASERRTPPSLRISASV